MGLTQHHNAVATIREVVNLHLITGKRGLILPCLGRTEADLQKSGPQFVTVEDSMGVVHKSEGAPRVRPTAVTNLPQPRPVQYHDLRQQRPLPRHQKRTPCHLLKQRRHGQTQHQPRTTSRYHQPLQRRDPHRKALSSHPLRYSQRLRRRSLPRSQRTRPPRRTRREQPNTDLEIRHHHHRSQRSRLIISEFRTTAPPQPSHLQTAKSL